MLPGFLLSLREGLEITLIIGIVLGALRKTQQQKLSKFAWAGVFSASLLSLGVAVALHSVGTSLQGKAEEIFEGFTMLLAAGVLTWMIFWMQRQSRNIKSSLEAGVRKATLQSGGRALFTLAFVAVLREGIELALFLTAAAQTTETLNTMIGAIIGLGLAIVLGWLLFSATLRLDLRRFFQVTGAVLILFAAGLVAHGVHEFNEVGWIPVIIEHVWDTNFILNEASFLGEMLKALFGYNGNPSLTEVFSYWIYMLSVIFVLRRQTVSEAVSQQA